MIFFTKGTAIFINPYTAPEYHQMILVVFPNSTIYPLSFILSDSASMSGSTHSHFLSSLHNRSTVMAYRAFDIINDINISFEYTICHMK